MAGAGELHPIFVSEPEEWMQYVYKKVSLMTDDQEQHEGWVYTVDPVSQNFVLVQFTDDRTTLSIVMHESIVKKTLLGETSPAIEQKLDALFRPKSEINYTEEELNSRKEKLKLWLERNRLPVQVTGNRGEVLTISNAVVIQPPYGVHNCHSTNEIILGRIQGLMKSMPDD